MELGIPPQGAAAPTGASLDEPAAVPLGAAFPTCCAKCAVREGAVPRTLRFGYVHPAAVLTLLVPPLFALVAGLSILITRRRVVFSVPICDACYARWMGGRRAVLGLYAFGALSCVFWAAVGGFAVAVIALLLTIFGPMILSAVLQKRAVRLVRFDKGVASIAGLHPAVAAAFLVRREADHDGAR